MGKPNTVRWQIVVGLILTVGSLLLLPKALVPFSIKTNESILETAVTTTKCKDDETEFVSNFGQTDPLGKDALANIPKKSSKFLDFFIMGFPKCATSSLMQLFMKAVNETDIVWMDDGNQEYNVRHMKNVERLLEKIEEGRSTNSEVKKYGIKWPVLHKDNNLVESMKNLIESNPQHEETKIIIGMRHPVRFFESFWNFRELRDHDMPPPSTLIGSQKIAKRGVYTELAQFEKNLMLLGKFDLVHDDFAWLEENYKTVLSTKNKVFLYLQEQFQDENTTRFQTFLDDMLSFVGVEEAKVTPDDFPHYNVINGKKPFDICDEAHKEIRDVLLSGGKASAKWFEKNLENSRDVYVSDKEYFLSMVNTWGHDPCIE
jgi:hypothetical protein